MIDLYPTEYERLVRTCTWITRDRHRSEDVVQDAFLRVVEGRCNAQPGKEPAYLRSVALNGARGEMRRLNRQRRCTQGWGPLFAQWSDGDTRAAEIVADLAAAIGALPARQQTVLRMRYVEDRSEAETAHALGISAGSVKTHLHRAVMALRVALAAYR